jgi:hypothetical protein
MTQYRVLDSEGRQRYIYTKTHKNIKEKKLQHPIVSLENFFSEGLSNAQHQTADFTL